MPDPSPEPDASFRDLLAAIHDALDVPPPVDYTGQRACEVLQRSRARAALAAVDAVLHDEPCAGCVEAAADILRERIQQLPVTYRPFEAERPDGGNPRLLPPEPQVAPSLTSGEAADVR